MHIGLIGGIGPAATEFYYQNLLKANQLSGDNIQPELTICHAQACDLIRNIQAGAVDEQVKIFEVLANRLSAAGAQYMKGTGFCARRSLLPATSLAFPNRSISHDPSGGG